MGTVTEDDIGKPILTAKGRNIGTLGGVDGPTMYIDVDDDIDPGLLSDMKIAEITGIKAEGETLAGAPLASVADVTDEEIRFWPSYAAESEHESVSYEDIPEEESHTEDF